MTMTEQSPSPTTERLVVTQADREAAWPYRAEGYRGDAETRAAWMTGVFDSCRQIQAFAAHRETSTASLQAEIAELRESAAQSVAAERERCAKIANRAARAVALNDDFSAEALADLIAAGIRNEGGNHAD